ncbi:ABC transporter ATP-binding protein [Thermopolyspora flexuosa]|jgi:ABC-type branched-subunit amino acid transport system ATPase component|uniref:Amino acid/amide ABC transporter ATP-binding protein 1 (HAAT family) n=1 Tax=Thermopolyspora flexuosa TaxID=103836 RepID=A0A543J4H4_9ACTN|nr:ABC transporter ATP-binding protein [Thermopolyspora flexuosa]TQM77734.1 amino acid/amide ABC transporter ATP-binding protein 1 (HAAT family) [Thermopolyspora flexuosa]GGM71066.1 ABC transporter ATP-binding protein [Thermopolyspora flexuosa]
MLEATDIRVKFGGNTAVDGVSLRLGRGEVVGLVGPNGSGKTSFLNAICGIVPATGSLTLRGVPVPMGRPLKVRAAGLSRTFQTPQVFDDLTCVENVMLSGERFRRTGFLGATLGRRRMLRDEHERTERARRALATVGLDGMWDRPAKGLAYGQARYLEIARALAGEPAVIALDEPSAGLNAEETNRLAELLRSVSEQGVSLLIVDHKIEYLSRICDRIDVLELGRLIASGPPERVFQDPAVIEAYLGT